MRPNSEAQTERVGDEEDCLILGSFLPLTTIRCRFNSSSVRYLRAGELDMIRLLINWRRLRAESKGVTDTKTRTADHVMSHWRRHRQGARRQIARPSETCGGSGSNQPASRRVVELSVQTNSGAAGCERTRPWSRLTSSLRPMAACSARRRALMPLMKKITAVAGELGT